LSKKEADWENVPEPDPGPGKHYPRRALRNSRVERGHAAKKYDRVPFPIVGPIWEFGKGLILEEPGGTRGRGEQTGGV